MIKLCVVTGSRAEYGLLKPVISQVKKDPAFKLQLIATGMHLDTRYSCPNEEIENDGINIDEKIEMNLASDSAIGICKSMGIELIGLSEAYERLKPDMILLLGDRYETFIAAGAAVICKIPIAHIHGGEITQGAYDDCMRHAITKMSYLHFTSTKEYRTRVIQLGEDPERVFHVGALGIENIKTLTLLTKEELEESLKIPIRTSIALVTLHPTTLDVHSISAQFEPLTRAFDHFPELFILFTKSNSDTGGNQMNEMIEEYADRHPEKTAVFSSLGTLPYLSLVSYSRVVIGNSSSGILEVPYLKVPSVDIGSRQKGRIKPDSVINCGFNTDEIIDAIQKALTYDWHKEKANPYEAKDTSKRIISVIKQTIQKGINLEKDFYDIR